MSSPRNILIYRLGSLGDTVVALPCFHLIRKVYPGSKITILTNQPISGKAAPVMAILENSGLCDQAISYPVGIRNVFELAKLRQTIRQIQPHALINLAAGRSWLKSLRDNIFFRSCGIKDIIGTPLRRRDLQVQQQTGGEFEPESQRLASRLVSLGTINLADQRLWELGLNQKERSQALELLPSTRKPLMAVSVGTKLPVKDWGEENWEKLLALLSREMPDTTLILLGSADESERSEKISRVWKGGHINLCGKTSPRISAAILEHCRLFIGHDSGPMHLASAVGVPTLGLFSWLNPPGQWFPGHKSWKFIKILYPELPGGRWKPNLQMRRGVSEGIRLLQPNDVFCSATELWHLNSNGSSLNSPLAKIQFDEIDLRRLDRTKVCQTDVGRIPSSYHSSVKLRLILLTHPPSFRSTSMPRFAGMIARGMAERGHKLEAWTSPSRIGRLPIRSPYIRKWLGYVDQYLLYPRKLRKLIGQQPDDTLFVVADQALAIWVPCLAHRHHVIHCHDFLALKSALGEHPENPTGWTGRQYQRLIQKGFSRGTAFISDSRKTQTDLHRFLPRIPKISEVIHNGLNHPFQPMELTERMSLLKMTGVEIPEHGFILHISGHQWYKNPKGVLEIYRAYVLSHPRPVPLWMVGEQPPDQLSMLAASIPSPGKVHFLTGLTNEQVNAAYSHARALLFPSLEEGFGWPVVEAMASECLVITTNIAPLTEIAGESARLIPRMPANVGEQKVWAKSAAEIMAEVVHLNGKDRTNLLKQGKLNAARFTAETALEAYEKVYLQVMTG